MIRTATVKIHGGDYDCSESIRMCYAAAGVLHWGYWESYMWTGNEPELLLSHDFREIPVGAASSMRRGDVLLKSGHTEMYLGNGMQAGARGDERGGIGYGAAVGDQTGNELAKSAYRQGQWTRAFRYQGPVNINGIPAAEIAAQVMEHLVSHDASHGYSQPARAGNGAVETIAIRWDDGVITYPKEDDMTCIISISGRNTLCWFDGVNINDLTATQEVSTLKKIYKACLGKDMPMVTLSQEEFARLCQSIHGGFPKHLKDLVDKYKTRSPE